LLAFISRKRRAARVVSQTGDREWVIEALGPQSVLMPKARTAALRALELDESLAAAHASLALIRENYDYDWGEAEKEFRRAIQLNPQYATAHQWYAESLSWQGRFQEAFAESEQARQLDPWSLIIGRDHAEILYYSRHYESAVKQYLSLLEMDPNFHRAQNDAIPPYLQLGRYDEAIEEVGSHGCGRGKRPSMAAQAIWRKRVVRWRNLSRFRTRFRIESQPCWSLIAAQARKNGSLNCCKRLTRSIPTRF
jgi:hypothetical protein